MKRRFAFLGVALVLAAASPLLEPRLLAFPHAMTVGADEVYSTAPLSPAELAPLLSRADALALASPLAHSAEGRHVFLTDGGWRWRWLATSSSGAFALTRPFTDAIVVNRSDVAADRVFNRLPVLVSAAFPASSPMRNAMA